MTKDRFFECCRNAAMKERTAEKQFKDVPWEYGELVYVGDAPYVPKRLACGYDGFGKQVLSCELRDVKTGVVVWVSLEKVSGQNECK